MTLVKFPGKGMTERLSNARFDSIDIPELIGLCKGVLADGTINLAEAEFIKSWLDNRSDVLDIWPADELNALLERVLADNLLSGSEEAELMELLEEITGEPVSILFY